MNWKPFVDRRTVVRDPKPLSDSLKEWSKEYSTADTDGWTSIMRMWDEVVGADIAANVRPHSLKDCVLVVAVSDPAWQAHFQFLAEDVRSRLSDSLAGLSIERIDVRLTR